MGVRDGLLPGPLIGSCSSIEISITTPSSSGRFCASAHNGKTNRPTKAKNNKKRFILFFYKGSCPIFESDKKRPLITKAQNGLRMRSKAVLWMKREGVISQDMSNSLMIRKLYASRLKKLKRIVVISLRMNPLWKD